MVRRCIGRTYPCEKMSLGHLIECLRLIAIPKDSSLPPTMEAEDISFGRSAEYR